MRAQFVIASSETKRPSRRQSDDSSGTEIATLRSQ